MKSRKYSELIRLETFDERFEYLVLRGTIGKDTFGLDRYLNQKFYNSMEWKTIRKFIIVRDNACDLGISGLDIYDKIIIHHMNPVTIEDLEDGRDIILDPEFLISTSLDTHNAIHFGNKKRLFNIPLERRRGDTTPWKVF